MSERPVDHPPPLDPATAAALQELARRREEFVGFAARRLGAEHEARDAVQTAYLLYKNYMISPQWEVKRAEAVKADGNACRKCGRKGKVEVHHITYKRMGAELPEDLIAVCPACHAALDAATGFGKGRREARRG